MIPMLLAALVDAEALRARRAALHEVARRTEPPKGPDARPTFVDLMLKGWQLHVEKEGPDTPVRRVISQFPVNLGSWLRSMIAGFTAAPLELVEGATSIGRVDEPMSLVLPASELSAYRAAVAAGVPFRGTVRTEADPILAAFWATQDVTHGELFNLVQRTSSIADWMRAEPQDLTGWSARRILDASEAWHAQFRRTAFRAPCPEAVVLLRYPDGWTLQRLVEKADLAHEGASMGHCVGGPPRANGRPDGESEYWQKARDDRSTLLSVRDPDGVPHATIEVTGKLGRIVQVQGPEDQCPEAEVLARIGLALHRLQGWKHGVPHVNLTLAPNVVRREDLQALMSSSKAQAKLSQLTKRLRERGTTTLPVPLSFALLDDLRSTFMGMKGIAGAVRYASGVSIGWAKTGSPDPAVLLAPIPPAWGVPIGGFFAASSTGTHLWLFWDKGQIVFRVWSGVGDDVQTWATLESFLYGVTGFLPAPPDTSDLEIVGAPSTARWSSFLRMPIADARARRTSSPPESS
jgi:hypothetical protein